MQCVSLCNYVFLASELRSWLFHYSLPCLRGILPERYLHHYLLLVNAVWLVNQESITKEDLACSNFCFLKLVLYFDGLYGELINKFITWLAPQAGNMTQIARWLLSGQDGAILPTQDYPLYPARKISPKAI